METVLPLVYLLIGAALGSGVVWLLLKGRADQQIDQSHVNQAAEQARLQAQLSASADHVTRLEAGLAESAQYREQVARLETQLSEERKQGIEKLALLTEAKAQLTTEFQNLANKILEEKSQKFTEQNKTNIDQVLNPLREQLGDFRKKVEDVYEKESKDRVSLFHEISSLKAINQRISDDAINLTNALKGQTQTQGAWGEVILERVLEESGLHKGREYETQGSFTTDEGKRLRPDVIVHLPEGKDVVIDSKATLVAYERYCAADDEARRQAALKEHIASIKSHIKGLSVKNYDDLPGLTSLDFVLMFIPIEAAFITAVEHDQAIFREAFEKSIIIVSPTTLLATLRTIHNIWRYEHQNRNSLEIADRAGKLYDHFVLFSESLLDVGDKLSKAQLAYDKARNRLSEGKGNLVSKTEKLKTLGAKAKKSMPDQMLGNQKQREGALPLEDA